MFTGGSLYEVILYDENITVNLEFQAKFSQYCDDFQMSKIMNLINNEYNEDIIVNNYEDIPYVIDETKFEIDDMDSDELKIKQEFFNDFGTAVFGEVINNLCIFCYYQFLKICTNSTFSFVIFNIKINRLIINP